MLERLLESTVVVERIDNRPEAHAKSLPHKGVKKVSLCSDLYYDGSVCRSRAKAKSSRRDRISGISRRASGKRNPSPILIKQIITKYRAFAIYPQLKPVGLTLEYMSQLKPGRHARRTFGKFCRFSAHVSYLEIFVFTTKFDYLYQNTGRQNDRQNSRAEAN